MARADRVEFLGNGEVDWALFPVDRCGFGNKETLWARKDGQSITFGRLGIYFAEASDQAPPERGERTIRIAVLKRVLEGTRTGRLSGGRFEEYREGESVVYRTNCGERRRVRLAHLRAIIEDAEALP